AAATAMATGRKVYNNVISEAIPGNGRDLKTVLEYMKGLGKRTGLVSTAYITHATPAAFAAHTGSRNNLDTIGNDYLFGSRPNLLFGGGGNGAHGLSAAETEAAGYHTVTTKIDFAALVPESFEFYSAQFGTDHMPYMYDDPATYPQLSDMTAKALALLENGPNGFFLMVEGGRIDHAEHDHDLARMVSELLEFEDAISTALAWRAGHPDAVIIVTADHETGGVAVRRNNGVGVLPSVDWTAPSHTNADVPVFASGTDRDILFGQFDNTYIHDLVTDFFE
ncbi:MAG TPA: alkaline phosphatase, partial [Spirochaetia bacterium]|nr:alkaline phosphatase [Spirochaetia bacterium]